QSVNESFRSRRYSFARWACAAVGGARDGEDGNGNRRVDRHSIWKGRVPFAAERSILVSSARRSDGNGLAFFGNHNVCNGGAKTWIGQPFARTRDLHLRRSRPALEEHA